MSVSDPLIRDIKGLTLRLHNESKSQSKITDSNGTLQKFCETLENIFFRGFIQYETRTFYGCKSVDLYSLLWKLSEERRDLSSYAYASIFETIRDFRNVRTPLGRFRLLLRHCLAKKCIEAPLEFLSSNTVSVEWHYQRSSIIGDEILSAILLSVLLQCNKINFDLNLYNYAFLDYTWHMPLLKRIELVPCDQMGIGVSFSENKAVIVNIEANSVVAESEEVSVGDVLDILNGVEIDSSCKGRLNSIFRMRKGLPVDMVIIKAHSTQTKTEDIYPPIKRLLDNLKFDIQKIKAKISTTDKKRFSANKTGYKATYLGHVDVGDAGGVNKIHGAIRSVLRRDSQDKKEAQEVLFEIGEINVKVTNLATDEIILKHSYMQISSCGSAPNLPKYIAYIAGEESCDTASNFICYVFHLPDPEDACTVLQSIGQGFYRTHFAV